MVLIYESLPPAPIQCPPTAPTFSSTAQSLGLSQASVGDTQQLSSQTDPLKSEAAPNQCHQFSSSVSSLPGISHSLSSAHRKFLYLDILRFSGLFCFVPLNTRLLTVLYSRATSPDPHGADSSSHSGLTQHWCPFLRKVFCDHLIYSGHPIHSLIPYHILSSWFSFQIALQIILALSLRPGTQ